MRRSVLVLSALLALLWATPLGAKPEDYTELGDGDWRGATLMAGLDGALWIIDSGGLYRISTK